MLLRWLFGIFILGATAAMTTMLVRLAYFPAESSLAKEEPALVLERFLSRTAAESVLDIYKGKDIVGTLKVTPHVVAPRDKLSMGAQGKLRIEGDLQVTIPGLDATKIKLLSSLWMSLDGDTKKSELSLSVGNNAFGPSLIMNHDYGATEPHILLKQGDTVLMDTHTKRSGGAESDLMMGLFLRSMGLDAQELKKRQQQTQQGMGNVKTEARRGGFIVMGHQFNGYILTTTLGGPDKNFTLYISDSGELVQMKTSFLDYQFMSEDLRVDDGTGPTFRSAKRHLPLTLPSDTSAPSP